MSHLLAIDQGTTSTRSLLFDSLGTLLATVQREFAQSYPQPGWVEHDPQTIWRDVLETAREVIHPSSEKLGRFLPGQRRQVFAQHFHRRSRHGHPAHQVFQRNEAGMGAVGYAFT